MSRARPADREEKGQASPSLLTTYSLERQPVGQSVITRANDAFRDHSAIWDALGLLSSDLDERKHVLQELSSPSPAGRARRKAFQSAIQQTAHEFHGLGQEMGQRYVSAAVYIEDEKEEDDEQEEGVDDPVLHYIPSTYPGRRLPHVWLNTACPRNPLSTIDLAGKGEFTLLTGIGGQIWKDAASQVATRLGIPINAYAIGFRQDYEDVYFDWARVRGVDESGCVLVRPDRFVAWRCADVDLPGGREDCVEKLERVVRRVLGLVG
jgi:hypothetical protein